VYTLWVGGSELNSNYLNKTDADYWAQEMIEMGYDDVIVEYINEY
jgi:hypothetical protein